MYISTIADCLICSHGILVGTFLTPNCKRTAKELQVHWREPKATTFVATDVHPVPPRCLPQRPRPRMLLPSTIAPRFAGTDLASIPLPAWFPQAVIFEAQGIEAGPFIFTRQAFHTCRNDKIPRTHKVSTLPER